MKKFWKKNSNRIKDIKTKKKYIIRESIYGNFYYHISSDFNSLCSKKNTMVTSIPIEAWGTVSHLNERYCKECEEIYKKEK